jgi:hypothetical protein
MLRLLKNYPFKEQKMTNEDIKTLQTIGVYEAMDSYVEKTKESFKQRGKPFWSNTYQLQQAIYKELDGKKPLGNIFKSEDHENNVYLKMIYFFGEEWIDDFEVQTSQIFQTIEYYGNIIIECVLSELIAETIIEELEEQE